MIDLYNPFKPHIVICAEGYRVRKFSLFELGWVYRDSGPWDRWYLGNSRWINIQDFDSALDVLNRIGERRIKNPNSIQVN